MIVATEDNTDIHVLYTDNGVAIEDEHTILQKYDVFTVDSFYMDGRPHIDFTGSRILANKPVSVYSGNGLALLYVEVN